MTAEGVENPPDLDPLEVVEWQDSIEAVIREYGEKKSASTSLSHEPESPRTWSKSGCCFISLS